MISVKRLKGEMFFVNPELIETIEKKNNTLITMANGNRYMVQETVEEIKVKIIDYYRQVRRE